MIGTLDAEHLALWKAMIARLRAAEAVRDFVTAHLSDQLGLDRRHTITDDGLILLTADPIRQVVPSPIAEDGAG